MSENKLTDFVFIYELQPSAACSNFHFESTPFGQNDSWAKHVQFLIWQDMLAVIYHNLANYPDFETVAKQTDSIVTAILASYAFLTASPFQFVRENWVEITGTPIVRVVGRSGGHGSPDKNHKANDPFKEIDQPLLRLILNTPALRRAIHDFYLCSSRLDSDFFVYAYRAAEDIRSHFGPSETDAEKKRAWNAMNQALGQQEADYSELVRLSKDSRHSNLLEEPIDPAIAKRNFDFVRSLILSFVQYLLAQPNTPTPAPIA